MRLRYELALALCASALLTGLATTLVQAHYFASDQESYLEDLHSQTARSLKARWEGEGRAIYHALTHAASDDEVTAFEKRLNDSGTITQSGAPPSRFLVPLPNEVENWGFVPIDDFRDKVQWVGRYRNRSILLTLSGEWLKHALDVGHGMLVELVSEPSNDSLTVTTRFPAGEGNESLGTRVPLAGDPVSALFVTSPLSHVTAVVSRTYRRSAWIALFCVGLCVALGLLYARRLSGPIHGLARQSLEVAKGNFGAKVTLGTNRGNEIGLLARSFNQMSEELESLSDRVKRRERLSALGQFSAGIAHEIKNPLASILANTQVAIEFLGEQKDLDPAIRKTLNTVCDETKRANRIVSGLLQFARQQKPELEKIDLCRVVKDSLETMAPLIQGSQVKLNLELSSEPLVCWGSRDPVHQVLLNLVQNALFAMRGVASRELTIAVRDLGISVALEVRDTGEGMSSEVRERIFEPFFTTKNIGEGNGLGLAVSHGIIESMGGKIEVESEPGKGSRFRVQLRKENFLAEAV